MKTESSTKIGILVILFVALSNSILIGQNKIIDSLRRTLSKEKNDTSLIVALNNIGEQLYPFSPDSAYVYWKSAIKHLRKRNQTSMNSPEYVTFKKRALATLLNNLAAYNEQSGNIQKAIALYGQSLKLHEELKDSLGIAQTLNNLGVIYNKQKEFEKALEYQKKALEITTKLNHSTGMIYTYNNLGLIYHNLKDPSKALNSYTTSLKISESAKHKPGIAQAYHNIANIYQEQGQFNLAIDYFLKGLKMREEMNNNHGISSTLNSLCRVHMTLKKYEIALSYANRAMEINKKFGFVENTRNTANMLIGLHKFFGNNQLALENYELYIQMRDSINNIETQKATIKQQTQYEYDKKKALADKEHELQLKQQEEQAAAEKAKQNIIIASVSLVLILVAVFSVFLYNRFKVTQRQKTIIEQKERETNEQKHIIEEKHKEITDSINYAERIQRSFLATNEHLNTNLQEYFILFKPKDVVSGDFYWSATLNNGHFALATADSTGHGVPGAIMSLLNITSLEKAIETYTTPSEILNATRKIIIERLKRDGSAEGGKDGMDCSLCVYDFNNMKLYISAAHNPVWVVRQEEVIEIKADKMPVGKHDRDQESFSQQEITLQKGDVVYTLTDGFPDQFGGEKGKKFMSKNLRELLAKNASLPLNEQKQLLEKTFSDWVGNLEQVDDVCVIGIKI